MPTAPERAFKEKVPGSYCKGLRFLWKNHILDETQKIGETFLFFPEFSPGIEKVI